jgi:hypothetical protein
VARAEEASIFQPAVRHQKCRTARRIMAAEYVTFAYFSIG